MLGISYYKEDSAILLLSEPVLDMDQRGICLWNSDLRGHKKKFLPESFPPLQCYLNFYHHVAGCGQAPSRHIALCQKQSQPKEPTSFFLLGTMIY